MGDVPGGVVDVKIEWNAQDLRSLLAALKQADPNLATSLRRRLRKAGDETVAEMRDVILSMPAKRDYGVRQGIAAGIKTQVMTSKRSNGVRIVATSSRLGDRAAMLKALNSTSFRHPVFGSRDRWVEQQGRPYFGQVITRHREALVAAVEAAIVDTKRAFDERAAL